MIVIPDNVFFIRENQVQVDIPESPGDVVILGRLDRKEAKETKEQTAYPACPDLTDYLANLVTKEIKLV